MLVDNLSDDIEGGGDMDPEQQAMYQQWKLQKEKDMQEKQSLQLESHIQEFERLY